MALKSLMDMFKLPENHKENTNLNVSLQQGVNFNYMQNKIEQSVEPQLNLIEQTTSPNLGSIIENFSNGSESPLTGTNEMEYKKIQQLEDQFNKALSKYTAKQNAMTSKPLKGNVKGELDGMFKVVQEKAGHLRDAVQKFHAQRQDLTGQAGRLTKQKANTLNQLKTLQSRQDMMDRLMAEGSTLQAKVEDNRLQMNAAYLHYFIWFAAAVTLGLVAIKRSAN